MFKNSKSQGVTLVELSIVLAILGILVVATISGRSLIDISRATATIQQLSDRTLVFDIFQSTYDCMPGDCIDATTKISSVVANANGNGDVIINLGGTTYKNELAFVDEHLTKAKLFTRTVNTIDTGLVTALPSDTTKNHLPRILAQTKVPGAYISSVSSNAQHFHIVGGFTTTNITKSDLINAYPVPPTSLQILDTKIDDGAAGTGEITAYSATYTQGTTGLFVLPAVATNYSTNVFIANRF